MFHREYICRRGLESGDLCTVEVVVRSGTALHASFMAQYRRREIFDPSLSHPTGRPYQPISPSAFRCASVAYVCHQHTLIVSYLY